MEALQEFLQQYGYLCIFILVLLEYANAPLPSELVLPLIGFLIVDGYMEFVPALLVSTIAGILGSLINYMIGRYFSKWTKNALTSKNKKMEIALSESIRWVKKYGSLSVMLSRVIPLIRTIIAIPAGLIKMPVWEYIVFSGIGICIWNMALISLGVLFAGNMDKIAIMLSGYSSLIAAIIILIVLRVILKKIKKRKKENI